MDQVHDSVVVTDLNGYITSWNKGAERMHGYTAEESIGRHVSFLYPEEERDFLRDDVIAGVLEKGTHETVARNHNKEGSDLYIQLLLSLLRDKEGRPVGMIGYAIDVTERKKATDALRESEERFRSLFEHSPDAVFLLKDSVFIAANPAVSSILGYAPEETIGLSPWEISPEFQPDGKPSKEKAQAMIAAVAGGPHTFDWVHKHKGGALLDCEVSLSAYIDRGSTLVQAIVRDVTEHKRSEENRRKLERDLDAEKRQFYRETIRSVTGGKLEICDDTDIRPYTKSSQIAFDIRDTSDCSEARRLAVQFCREQGLAGERLDSFTLGFGEAITNAVKHGRQGQLYAGVADGAVWVGVSDKGQGIPSLVLPLAVLLRGYSTKPSLGLGYTIMLDVCDRVLLKTDQHGTTVVLMKQLAETPFTVSIEQLPDTWTEAGL